MNKYEKTLLEHAFKRSKTGNKPILEDYILDCFPSYLKGSKKIKKALKNLISKGFFLKQQVKNQFVYKINPKKLSQIKKEIWIWLVSF